MLFFLFCFLGSTSALELLEVAEPITNQYIIQFKADVSKALRNEHISDMNSSSIILYAYDFPGFYGYAAEMGEKELAMALSSPHVLHVEQNGIMRASCIEQDGATWGLVRTAEEDLVITGEYKYEDGLGDGVDAYIIDTGIYLQHNDFGGRARWGTNQVDNDNTDGNGHGTHVAGTVGAMTYGLAKKCNLVAVKVLNAGGSGTTAGVIAGVNWVINDVNKKYGSKKRKLAKAVANMSLGGGRSTTLNNAVDAAVEAEVIMAVAAGNDYASACNYSPASAELAISTGASDNTDSMAYFSNYGSCVDVFAPGVSITSTWSNGPSSINTISGTSMAAPHIAGIAAKLITEHPGYDADKIKDELLAIASEGKLSGVRDSPNLLSYHGCFDDSQ